MENVNYNALMVSSRRETDDYVLATNWGKAFDKEWRDYRESAKYKKLSKALAKKLDVRISDIIQSKKGRGAKTWVHPVIAVDFAEWLSTDFGIFVKEIFLRWLGSDITLADEILQRQDDPEKVQWLIERAEGKKARLEFTDELKKRGVTTGQGYAKNTNAGYYALFDKGAKEIKKERNVKHTRDGMTSLELAAVRLTELAAIERMIKHNANGENETVQQTRLSGKKVRAVLDDCQ